VSDLQCPARFVLLDVALTELDEVAALRDERPAALCVEQVVGRAAAERVAASLGLPARDWPAGDGTPHPEALATLADLHRGETVVVAGSEALLAACAPGTTPGTRLVTLQVDADGTRIEKTR
jgi:hypothetical protein